VDLTPRLIEPVPAADIAATWAASGAMALTGPAEGAPLGAPSSVVTALCGAAGRLTTLSEEIGRRVVVNGPALLAERAASTGHHRRGRVSCGGSARLLPAADGWLAVSLARADDVDLLPAWLGAAPDEAPLALPYRDDDVWRFVAAAVRTEAVTPLVQRAVPLGLPVAALGERAGDLDAVLAHRVGDARPTEDVRDRRVVDLSSLWAGPSCGRLLRASGLRVVKVESTTRPDGARVGDPVFFDRLNHGKESVTVDLRQPDGVDALRALVAWADVVIEGSRPRALRQLGIEAGEVLAAGGRTRIWVALTAHGRAEPYGRRVGFGDDAAVAGGLVAWEADGYPCFLADAAADPASGLLAAVAVLDRLRIGGRWLLDVALSRVAARLAVGPPMPSWPGPIAAPADVGVAVVARTGPQGRAAALGADTRRVLDEIGAGA
jgi:hypothetical protein